MVVLKSHLSLIYTCVYKLIYSWWCIKSCLCYRTTLCLEFIQSFFQRFLSPFWVYTQNCSDFRAVLFSSVQFSFSKFRQIKSNLLRPAQTGQHVGQHVVQQIRPICLSGLLWQRFCLTNTCKCPFICYKKKHLKFYDFDIWFVKRNSNLNSMLACTSNRTNMSFLRICWPTFLDFLRNVGHYFSFTNMFVP